MHVGIVVALAAHSRALERSYMSKHGTPGSFFNTSPTDAPDSLKSDTHSTNTGVLSELVQILKALQIYSMGVDTDLSPEENVEYLTNYLHWAEVQIEKLHSQALQRIKNRLPDVQLELGTGTYNDGRLAGQNAMLTQIEAILEEELHD